MMTTYTFKVEHIDLTDGKTIDERKRFLLEGGYEARYQAFSVEQNIHPKYERDSTDEICQHWVIYRDSDEVGCLPTVAGTMRAEHVDPQNVKLSRIAILKEFRGLGLGKQLMVECESFLQKGTDYTNAVLTSLTNKAGFYEKLGYVAVPNSNFVIHKLEHIKMNKSLV